MTTEYFSLQDFEGWLLKTVERENARSNKKFFTTEGTFHDELSAVFHLIHLKNMKMRMDLIAISLRNHSMLSPDLKAEIQQRVQKMNEDLQSGFFKTNEKLSKSAQRYTQIDQRTLFLVEATKILTELSVERKKLQTVIASRHKRNFNKRHLEAFCDNLEKVMEMMEGLNKAFFHFDDEEYEKFCNLALTDQNPIARLDEIDRKKMILAAQEKYRKNKQKPPKPKI